MMGYTKEEKLLYLDIKQAGLANGEAPELAELIAREYLYYTRRDKFYEIRKDRDDIDGYGHKIYQKGS